MKPRGEIKLSAVQFVQILEYWNVPSLIEEAKLYRNSSSKSLSFVMWVNSLNSGAREDMMMLALSKGNWARFEEWEDQHIDDFTYCKMLFPINEEAEKLYRTGIEFPERSGGKLQLCQKCAAEQDRSAEWDTFHYGTNARCDGCDQYTLCAMMPNSVITSKKTEEAYRKFMIGGAA